MPVPAGAAAASRPGAGAAAPPEPSPPGARASGRPAPAAGSPGRTGPAASPAAPAGARGGRADGVERSRLGERLRGGRRAPPRRSGRGGIGTPGRGGVGAPAGRRGEAESEARLRRRAGVGRSRGAGGMAAGHAAAGTGSACRRHARLPVAPARLLLRARAGAGTAGRVRAGRARRIPRGAGAVARRGAVPWRHGLRRERAGTRPAGAFGGARRRQRRLDRMAQRLVHLAAVAEAHLDLGGVHVHVDALGRHLQEQRVGGLAVAVQHVVVGAAHAVGEQAVAHVAAVDVEVLHVAARAGVRRQPGAAGDAQRAAEVDRDLAAVLDELGAEHVAQALDGGGRRPAGAAHRAPLLLQAAVVPDGEADVGARQRVAAHRVDGVRQLGRLGLQELAPRRRGVEQLAHLDGGADGARRGRQLAAARVEPEGVRRAGGAAASGSPRPPRRWRRAPRRGSPSSSPARGRRARRSCSSRGGAAPAAARRRGCRRRRPRRRWRARRRRSGAPRSRWRRRRGRCRPARARPTPAARRSRRRRSG